MSAKPISQREARTLKKRVKELERRMRAERLALTDGDHYVGSVNVPDAYVRGRLSMANTFGHALVATLSGESLSVYAVAIPKAAKS